MSKLAIKQTVNQAYYSILLCRKNCLGLILTIKALRPIEVG
jgi:hypothetical protein